jgi:hypothetical protein
MKEMASHGGHAPTQAAYTSLLAACYKICNDTGRNSHALRAKAGTFGWQYWQEMRIIGIEPDGQSPTVFCVNWIMMYTISNLENRSYYFFFPQSWHTELFFDFARQGV